MNKDCAIFVMALAIIVMLGYLARSEWIPPVENSPPETVHSAPRHSTAKRVTHHTPRVKKHQTSRQAYQVHQARPATRPDIRPAVYDTYQPRRSYTRDLTECKMLAQRAAGYVPEETIKGGLLGGAIGAAAGAAIGAVLGHPGKGAAIGAAAGGIGGGAYRGLSSDQKYRRAYSACMRNRGWNVLN